MPIMGWEWIVIVGVVVVFFLWGPNKIPQLARAVGQAKREIDTTSKELSSTLESPMSGPRSPSALTSPSTSAVQGAEDTLTVTAKKLGITTEGKTRDEISNEIIQKATANSPPPVPSAPPASLKVTEKTQRDP